MASFSRIIVIAGLMLAFTQPARASVDFLRIFSQCAGTYTAAVEHAWLMGTPEIDALERERGEIVDILEAWLGPDDGRAAMALRVEARAAHRRLLSQAAFGTNRTIARWSQARADEQLRACGGLLLKS